MLSTTTLTTGALPAGLAPPRPTAVRPARTRADIHHPLAEAHGGRAQRTARRSSTRPATEERTRSRRQLSPARVSLA